MDSTARNQDANHLPNGSFAPGNNANPEGKGGFQDRPQDRSDGRWDKNNTFSYWMNFFKSLTPAKFLSWEQDTPDEERTVAMDLAYARVKKARNDLREFQEVANRTEGMPRQTVRNEYDEEVTDVKIEVIRNAVKPEDNNSI